MYQDKKKKIIIIIAIFVILISIIFISIYLFKNRKVDVSNATHAVVLENNVNFYKKTKLENVKIYKQLDVGTNVYVLDSFEAKDGNNWSKVVINNKIGYILSEKIGYYRVSNKEMKLMVDVSKFNKIYNFKTAGEFGAFLINNNIDYVYIRAGGRGYGEKGNFYYDECYEMWAKECEFLKIPFGFYFLDEALNSKEINEEVKFIQDFLRDNKYEYAKLPVALDVEKHEEKGRADDIWNEREELVSELIKKLKNKDIETIVYSNAKTANQYLSSVNTKFWLAYYPTLKGKIPDYKYSDTEQEATQNEELMRKMIAWQFTENGVGSLISDKVDLSVVYEEFDIDN